MSSSCLLTNISGGLATQIMQCRGPRPVTVTATLPTEEPAETSSDGSTGPDDLLENVTL